MRAVGVWLDELRGRESSSCVHGPIEFTTSTSVL